MDIALDGRVAAALAYGGNKVTAGPESTAPQLFPELRQGLEQLTRGDALIDPHNLRWREAWRRGTQKMYMVLVCSQALYLDLVALFNLAADPR